MISQENTDYFRLGQSDQSDLTPDAAEINVFRLYPVDLWIIYSFFQIFG